MICDDEVYRINPYYHEALELVQVLKKESCISSLLCLDDGTLLVGHSQYAKLNIYTN